jgi:hypothetical protein
MEVVKAELIKEEVKNPFFRKVKLSEEKEIAISKDLFKHIKEAFDTRGDLDMMLARWNDMAEGIAMPKDFPWRDSSNLFIPITEIHLNNVHASARQTLFKGDQPWYVRSIGIQSDLEVANKLERFLNYKSVVELPILDRFSQLTWCAERDGTAIAQVQWLDDKNEVREVVEFDSVSKFLTEYPTAESVGMSFEEYRETLSALEVSAVKLVITKNISTYKGPIISVIQLQDFLMSPMSSIQTKFANMVGKVFTLRGPELKKYEFISDWDNVDDVINSKEDGRKDLGTSLKDNIEGISRRSGNGEFVLVDGIHRFDLNDDGREETYLFVYHPLTQKILYYMEYPYFHGKDCFIPIRIKKRANRFLGRGICQMLEDINSEINTQHNQRIDSRTITTVPSFKAKNSAKNKFDPTRKDSRFQPGRVFWLDSLDDIMQFDIKGTDMGESIQEESSLMSLADQQTGSSQLRSGKETKQDPRAPAAKVNMLLNQSNIRLDDYFEELAGNAVDNEGFNTIGEQLIELYSQFYDEDLAKIPLLKSVSMLPEVDPNTNTIKTIELSRSDFSIRNKYKIQMAKTSSMQNPDAMLLKFMQIFSLLINDPLVGGTPNGRMALIRRLLTLSREENPDQFLPPDNNMAAQLMMSMQQQEEQGGGNARTRNGQKVAGTPAAGGSTRPLG